MRYAVSTEGYMRTANHIKGSINAETSEMQLESIRKVPAGQQLEEAPTYSLLRKNRKALASV